MGVLMIKIKNMKKIYLAIPYSGMEESSYEQATLATAIIMQTGETNVFSPITHSHPLTKFEGIEMPGTWEFWEKVDYQYIDWSDEIWVLIPKESEYLELVMNSTGVMAEMKYAKAEKKKIKFFRVINNQIVFDKQNG